jgi:hypothetical protein
VSTRLRKGANAQVNRSAAHVLGGREFAEIPLCVAIGGITTPHRCKSRFAGCLLCRCGKSEKDTKKNGAEVS